MAITSRNSWKERYPLPSLSASVNMDSTKSESGFRPNTLANSSRVSSHCKASRVLLLKSPASLLLMSKTWSQKRHIRCYLLTLWHIVSWMRTKWHMKKQQKHIPLKKHAWRRSPQSFPSVLWSLHLLVFLSHSFPSQLDSEFCPLAQILGDLRTLTSDHCPQRTKPFGQKSDNLISHWAFIARWQQNALPNSYQIILFGDLQE